MKKLIFISISFLLSVSVISQNKSFFPYDNLFDADSLKGFDEEAVRQNAFHAGYFGVEFKVFMNYAKRNFINEKYNLNVSPETAFKIQGSLGVLASVNEDFESSPTGTITSSNQILGWTVTSGTNSGNNNSCKLTNGLTAYPNQPYAVRILQNGFIDPVIGNKYPIYSVFGANANLGDTVGLNAPLGQMKGDRFIRFNDQFANFGVHNLVKSFVVDTSNALFQFAFITVIAAAHLCCEAPTFQISIKNLTTSTASNCPSFSFAPGPTCVFTSPNSYYQIGTVNTATLSNGATVYSPWTIRNIDLRPFTGDSIQIEFVMADCIYGAHYGYAYLDAQCSPMRVLSDIPGGLQPICFTGSSATLSAVPGFTPYQWSGPGGFSSNTQSVTITTPGDYTLTIGDSCIKTTYIVPVITKPTVSVTPLYLLCSGNATLNVSGATTYTWLPDNLNGSSITPSPTITTTYTVVGANLSCTNSAVSTVSVMTAPPLTLISDVQTGCRNTCVTFSPASTDFDPVTYDWGDGSPVVALTTTHCYSVAGNYSVTAAATYSSGCTVITSAAATLTIHPTPVAGINIVGGSSQVINQPVTFNNTTTGGNSFTWDFQDSTALLNTNFLIDAIHTYTSYGAHCVKLIATDTVYRCKDSINVCVDIPCVSEIFFPDVFSPNGDDVNEVFTFPNICITELECTIYDRWGLKIYDWNKVHGGWDGRTIAGVALSDGTYFYILRYIDSDKKEIRKTGKVTLFR